MSHCVLMHRPDSIYDDSPAERYQFPKLYYGRISPSIGDGICRLRPPAQRLPSHTFRIFCTPPHSLHRLNRPRQLRIPIPRATPRRVGRFQSSPPDLRKDPRRSTQACSSRYVRQIQREKKGGSFFPRFQKSLRVFCIGGAG